MYEVPPARHERMPRRRTARALIAALAILAVICWCLIFLLQPLPPAGRMPQVATPTPVRGN